MYIHKSQTVRHPLLNLWLLPPSLWPRGCALGHNHLKPPKKQHNTGKLAIQTIRVIWTRWQKLRPTVHFNTLDTVLFNLSLISPSHLCFFLLLFFLRAIADVWWCFVNVLHFCCSCTHPSGLWASGIKRKKKHSATLNMSKFLHKDQLVCVYCVNPVLIWLSLIA